MMKTLFAAAMLFVCGSAMAGSVYTDAEGNEYTFNKHLYLQLQGGAQYTLGESKNSDLFSPNAQIALGYQFNPVVSARLAVGAWQSKGGFNGYQVDKTAAPGNKSYKYTYFAPGVDVMFNLSNLIGGYNPFRTVNVSAFVGAAANIASGNDEANDIVKQGYTLEYIWDGTQVLPVGRAGLAVDFRLSDVVTLGLEANANILSDKYNSKKAGNADWYFNGLVGLKINLGKTYTKKEKPAPEPEPAPAPVVVEKPAPAPAPVVEQKVEKIRRDIFYTIRVTKITDEEAAKVQEVVDYLNKYPESKVTVTGYADAGTGNDRINDRLAAQRAASVVTMLKAKGIDESRITSDSKGAHVQPFAENDKNRVSIVIAE